MTDAQNNAFLESAEYHLTILGHDAATYWNPVFLQHLLAGVQFAIGDLHYDAKMDQ